MKKLSNYSHEELMRLSNEEISKLMEEERRSLNNPSSQSPSPEDPHSQFDEKVTYWAGGVHRLMRSCVEDGQDPYSIYNLTSYTKDKQQEPQLDSIMEQVFSSKWNTQGVDWDRSIYELRIKEDYAPYELEPTQITDVLVANNKSELDRLVSMAKSKGIKVRLGEAIYYIYDANSLHRLIKSMT